VLLPITLQQVKKKKNTAQKKLKNVQTRSHETQSSGGEGDCDFANLFKNVAFED
jgi:hypothetical protein